MPKRKRKSNGEDGQPDSDSEELVAHTRVVRSDYVGPVEFLDERGLDELLPNRDRRHWR